MPRVSVILNCYNHEAYVGEAVDSVLAQTFADFELILIDNGSTDGSRGVLKGFKDKRIRRAFHDSNESLSRRLNQGVAMAEGEFVAVLYSDDLMLPDKLERQIAMFDRLPDDYGVVYCPAIGFNQFTGARWDYPSFRLSGRLMPAMLQRHWEGPIDMASPLVRRQCYVHFPFFEDLQFDGEAVFARIALGYNFQFDRRPTVKLRDHFSNVGKAIRANHEMAMEQLDRLIAEPAFDPSWGSVADRFRAEMLRQHSWALLRLDPTAGGFARRKLCRAIRLQPTQLCQPRFLASVGLSLVPGPVRRLINGIADWTTRHPGNRNFINRAD